MFAVGVLKKNRLQRKMLHAFRGIESYTIEARGSTKASRFRYLPADCPNHQFRQTESEQRAQHKRLRNALPQTILSQPPDRFLPTCLQLRTAQVVPRM